MIGRVKSGWLRFRRRGFVFAVLGCSALYIAVHFVAGVDPDFGGYNLLLSIDASVMGAWLLDLMLSMSAQDRAQLARIEAAEASILVLEEKIADRLGE